MNTYTLSRIRSGDDGTFGILKDESSKEICRTVELPWKNNQQGKSCVPAGSYICSEYQSPRHGKVWMLQDVPSRSNCEFHAANTIKDLEGCIGVGDEFGIVSGLPAVLHSQATLEKLRGMLPRSFRLDIVEHLI